LEDVIREIRDENARNYIKTLPYDLKIQSSESVIEKNDYILVSNFTKDTGDFKTLSQTDIKVITFGVYLAKQNGEFERIKKEPKPL
jgi:rRNA maturation endonuclease Nob1